MKLNKLHINKSTCYFVHFKPRKRADSSKNSNDNESESENTFVLKIAGEDIKKVSETKFLGITIDEKLSWDGQIKNVKRKLNFATASLNRIKNNLPEQMHKDLYHTLFESHLTYCISVWGKLPQSKMKNLFNTQKKCIRILFGDWNAYCDKFQTCVKARPIDLQKLGPQFYKKRAY